MAVPNAKPHINHLNCLHLRHSSSTCRSCQDACSHRAIVFSESQPIVQPSKCTGCGACVPACPSAAVSLRGSEDSAVFEQFKAQLIAPVVTFACSYAKRGKEETVDVGCFAALDPSLPLLAKAVRNHRVVFRHGDCKTCSKRLACNPAQALADKVRNFAAWAGNHVELVCEEKPQEIDGGRRAFLGRWFESGAAAKAEEEPRSEEVKRETLEMSRVVPDKHIRMLTALRLIRTKDAMGEPPEAISDMYQMPTIEKEKCSGCALCVSLCPSQAIKAARNGDEIVISLNPAACFSCGLCRDLCYTGAVGMRSVRSSEELGVSDLTELCRRPIEDKLLETTWEDKLSSMIDAPVYRT